MKTFSMDQVRNSLRAMGKTEEEIARVMAVASKVAAAGFVSVGRDGRIGMTGKGRALLPAIKAKRA